MAYQVLCVDADAESRSDTVGTLEAELADLDVTVETAGTVSDATSLLTGRTAAVVTEYSLPDGTGFDVIREAREHSSEVACILYTDTDPGAIDTAELRGTVLEYVGKGSVFGAERLARLLRTTVQDRVQGTYPLPRDEDERLANLAAFDLDDEDLVASLNRISDLAAAHFDVDAASVNIITEHSQEFLACHGGANEWETMGREDSICTFTILEDDVMVVEDVTEDPRFESRSDTLLGMGIRSYMGANLVTDSGLVLGPVCVYDDEPRSFSEADESYLRDLAAVAMDLIELHARRDADAPVGGGGP